MTNQEQDGQAHHSFDAMKVPEFRSLATGRFFFTMALRMMTTLLGWWIYNLTNAPFAIGLIGLSEVVPAVSLALYAGHIIDVSDKQKLLRRGIGLYFAAAIILLFLSTKNLPKTTAKYLFAHEFPLDNSLLNQKLPRHYWLLCLLFLPSLKLVFSVQFVADH